MNTIKQSILAIVIGLVLAAGVSYGYTTWSPPTANPTGNNPDAPINTGSTPQAKTGGLGIGYSDASLVPSNGLIVKNLTFAQGIASFNETAGFAKLATFSGGVKIPTDAKKGRVLASSDSNGNANWGNMKTLVKRREWLVSSKPSSWEYNVGSDNKLSCPSGYVRTGCNATCRGTWVETDARASGIFPSSNTLGPYDESDSSNQACQVGENDPCRGTKPDIRLYAICLKVE